MAGASASDLSQSRDAINWLPQGTVASRRRGNAEVVWCGVDPRNEPGTPVRSYKFRLRPTRVQTAALDAMLRDFCGLYNAGLQKRIEAYRRRSISLRYEQQAAELKACRTADPDGLGRWSFTALQQVLRRLDQTFTAFFQRRHGFPRFRASARYHAATFRVRGRPDAEEGAAHRPRRRAG